MPYRPRELHYVQPKKQKKIIGDFSTGHKTGYIGWEWKILWGSMFLTLFQQTKSEQDIEQIKSKQDTERVSRVLFN
jgi:hypothetical protein